MLLSPRMRCIVPKRKWVDVYTAARCLATRWNITQTIAESIIWNLLQSGGVLVRGVRPGSIVPSIISKEIAGTLYPGFLTVTSFHDVEIEWNDLIERGRDLVPSGFQLNEQYATSLKAAIAELLDNDEEPGKTISWKTFCDNVRDQTAGWASEHDKRPKRGFSDRTIQRIVNRQLRKAHRRRR
jgi:hypothetical protein